MSSGWRTVAQVAEQLEVLILTIVRRIAAGDLKAVRLPGGRLRVEQAEVDRKMRCWATSAGQSSGGAVSLVSTTTQEG